MSTPLHLVALHGTGDTYLVCALAEAVERFHHREVTVVVKPAHVAIPRMFGLRLAIDEDLVREAERNRVMQQGTENNLRLGVPRVFVHPSFVRHGARIDQLTVKGDVSQADMYRAILHLPPDAPLALPAPLAAARHTGVLLIPEARSWPNTQPLFWIELYNRLHDMGRDVLINDADWTLEQLLEECASAEWVIGPQCGVMSTLCAARFPCRKTFATPSVDGGRYPGLPVADTFPYAYVTKFAGDDYDVEEFKITSGNHAALVEMIAGGVNARRLRPVNLLPVRSVMAPLSPGDAADRLAVLQVKQERFGPDLVAGIQRELGRYCHLVPQMAAPQGLYDQLVQLHRDGFDMHERFVRGALSDAPGLEADHAAAVKLNKRRVELRQAIDAACGAATTEVKSYYTPQGGAA